LINQESNLVVVSHPLNSTSSNVSIKRFYEKGILSSEQIVKRHNFGFVSRLLDLFHTPRLTGNKIVFCFNPWALLLAKVKFRNPKLLIFWGVDYNPRRNSFFLLNKLLEIVEQTCLSFMDIHIENNIYALQARKKRILRTKNDCVSSFIVPITHDIKVLEPRSPDPVTLNIFYLGAVNKRNGIDFIVELAEEMKSLNLIFNFHIVGIGSEYDGVIKKTKSLELDKYFNFYGVLSQEEYCKISRKMDIAVAPYQFNLDSYTRFADPGKLVLYAALGLPTIVNRVPLIVNEYENYAGFVGMNDNQGVEDWVSKILQIKNDTKLAHTLSKLSLEYGARRTSNSTFLGFTKDLIRKLDLHVD
jgi:glycosyltransferase involved in cell wall biosynthesis